MVLGITAMLVVTVAEFSSFLSIVAVLVCFFAMFLLIVSLRVVFRNMTVFWLHGEEIMFGSSVHTVQQKIPQMKMMKVQIPFTFKLQETSRSSFSDIQCTVSSQVPYTLQVLWGVSIRQLHLFLWQTWGTFQEAIQKNDLPAGLYQHKGICISEDRHNEKSIMLSMPETNLELGRPPRLCYPLVIILTRHDTRLQPNEPVALINVVHIKDAVCTLPTNVLAQYLKQANGQLSSLKQLYLATGNPSPSSYEDSTETARLEATPSSGDMQLCVVCQTSPLSRALLPCRHTCICATCFTKLAQCPMCRSQIKSYFCVRTEDYLTGNPGQGGGAAGFERKNAPPTPTSYSRSWLRLRHRVTNLIRSAER